MKLTTTKSFYEPLDKHDTQAIAEGTAIANMKGLGRVYQSRRQARIYNKIVEGLSRKAIRPRKKVSR